MSPTPDSVLRDRSDDGVTTLTIDRPRRKNALTVDGWAALASALTSCASDGTRALVLRGTGGDLCAGADLSGDSEGSDDDGHPLARMRRINEVPIALHELSVPSIAAVDGVAVGAGWNLALGCDLVVATPRSRFSQIFARRGLSLDLGGSWLLPRIVGMQQAKRLALLGEMIDGEEAYRLGLVTCLVEPDEVDPVVADLAGRLAAGPPVALAQTKELLHSAVSTTLREALANEARAQSVNLAGDDARAAFEAFREKREPRFTGGWER
ncbi:enoyl-CoA hydratase/isomerase family protein [Actinomycetospora termitidis]|uniref:Enoyl-CoA hydratase-related protein n=1 Tax=Actinomycetospora termitidis TaxID=3053470 RepID=A0ABT7MHS2_9PSEU|nr:enoyl-CoA hydratase-related protein [Actinomycetospora sp. Odt1-22]MDL5158878.1 enoyl-CoA hydratase-related protein [Actinomycetospora sp. Odt1-22]